MRGLVRLSVWFILTSNHDCSPPSSEMRTSEYAVDTRGRPAVTLGILFKYSAISFSYLSDAADSAKNDLNLSIYNPNNIDHGNITKPSKKGGRVPPFVSLRLLPHFVCLHPLMSFQILHSNSYMQQ